MRWSVLFIFIAACGDTPLHVALDIVTPVDPATISSVQFQLFAPSGKQLSEKTAAEQNGALSAVNFSRPSNTTTVILKGTAFDTNTNELAVGQTALDISQTGALSATVFMSSPTAGKFTPHPRATKHHRFFGSAITLASGQIWFAGGYDQTNAPLTTTEYYDPLTLTFADGPNLQTPCLQPTLAESTSSGRSLLLVAGGHTSAGAACDGLQVIDTAAGTTGKFVTMGEPRRDAAAYVLSDGRVALLGGSGASDTSTTGYIVSITSPELSVFITPFSTSAAGFSLAAPVQQAFGALLGENFYLTGDSLAIQQLNATTGVFKTAGQFSVARTEPAVFVAGASSIYKLAGGVTDVERWSPVGTQNGVPKLEQNLHAPAALEVPGPRLVVSGGTTDSGDASSNALFYDLSSSTASLTSISLTTARAGHTMVLTSTNTILVVGGSAAGPTAELFSLP